MNNCVYRFKNDKDEIIYIGKAKNLKARILSHNHCSEECYRETVIVEHHSFETLKEAETVERYLISKYKPRFNKHISKCENNFELESIKWLKSSKLADIAKKNVDYVVTSEYLDVIKDFAECNSISKEEAFSFIVNYFYMLAEDNAN